MIKFANADEDAAIIAARIAALTHIEQVDPAVPVPRVRPGPNGTKIVSVAGSLILPQTGANCCGICGRSVGWQALWIHFRSPNRTGSSGFSTVFKLMSSPRLAGLRAQVIHGGLHEQNLILKPDGAVAGIIDFGDMIHPPLLFDLTGSASDLMTGNEGAHGNIVKIRPPIVFSRAHADFAVQTLDRAPALN